jgi:molybdenum cofactor cytidylyltransferase
MTHEPPGPAGLPYAGIVLAAGEAKRMGGRPKALIERDSVALVRRVALALLGGGVRDVVVVLGHRAQEVGAAIADLPVGRVVNEAYPAGRASSLRAGLAALPGEHDAVAVALADQALLETADVTALLRAFERRAPAARALVPRTDGERGHPVMLESVVCLEILARETGYGARDWIAAHPSEVEWLEAGHARYVTDVDAPEDLERIAQRHGCAMRWPDGF